MDKEHLFSKWKKCKSCRRSELMIEWPLAARTKELLVMSRTRLGTVIGLLTEHAALDTHLLNMRMVSNDECRLCSCGGEDSNTFCAVVFACCCAPVFARKKYKFWRRTFLENLQ